MGTNPRPKHNKRARSRLHKTNLAISEYIGGVLSFARGLVHWLGITGLRTNKEITGQTSFVCLEPAALLLDLHLKCQDFSSVLRIDERNRLPMGLLQSDLA